MEYKKNYSNLENFYTSLETSGFHTPSSSLAPRLSGQNCKGIFKVLLFLDSLRTLGYNETTLDISKRGLFRFNLLFH